MYLELVTIILAEEIWNSLKILASEFRRTYPFYDSWCKEIFPEIESGKRNLYHVTNNHNFIGILLINGISNNIQKINAIYVKPEYRNKGFGAEILSAYLRIIPSEIDYLFIQCKSDNDIVKKIIFANEFALVGTLVHKIEQAHDNEVFCRIQKSELQFDNAIAIAKKIYTRPGRKYFNPTHRG